MKSILAFLVLSLSFHAYAQSPKPATLRSILLEQLRTTHNEKDWFVPINVAVEGLTAEWQREPLRRPADQSSAVLERAGAGQVQGRAGAEIQRQQRRNLH